MFNFDRLEHAFSESGNASFMTEGFFLGLALGLLIVLILWLVIILIRRKSRSKGVTIPGENGNLIVTANAIRQFVTRILTDFPNASMRSVDLLEKRQGLVLAISINAAPEADLVELRDQISSRVMEEAGRRIGMTDTLKKVDVAVHSYEDKVKRSKNLPESDFPPE